MKFLILTYLAGYFFSNEISPPNSSSPANIQWISAESANIITFNYLDLLTWCKVSPTTVLSVKTKYRVKKKNKDKKKDKKEIEKILIFFSSSSVKLRNLAI